jgi:hypothetical protein
MASSNGFFDFSDIKMNLFYLIFLLTLLTMEAMCFFLPFATCKGTIIYLYVIVAVVDVVIIYASIARCTAVKPVLHSSSKNSGVDLFVSIELYLGGISLQQT